MNWNLHRAIKERGLTQRKFSLLVEDDESVVSRIVNGIWNPDPERQRKYAEVLGLTPEQIFEQRECRG